VGHLFLAPSLAAAASAWVTLLIAAPLLPATAGAVLYGAGSLLCHQIAERSFHLDGFQLPVCARCLGLYVGGAVGAAAALVGIRAARWTVALRRRSLIAATAIAALPTLLTFSLEWIAGWGMSNTARGVAALPLGFAVAFAIGAALRARPAPPGGLHYGECAP
jgi:uncharacterized membrane protein